MARITIPIALLLLCMGCSAPPVEQPSPSSAMSVPSSSEWVDERLPDQQPATWKTLPLETGTLVFGTEDTIRTGLLDLQLLKEFDAPAGTTWYLFQARDSNKDKGDKLSLYIFCPDKKIGIQAVQNPWHMPGRMFDGPMKESYYEAQVFTGEVLRDTFGVIWYDRSLMPDGKWKQNTVLLNLSSPTPDTLVLFGHERKSTTIDLAFRGKCEMLESIDQHIRHGTN